MLSARQARLRPAALGATKRRKVHLGEFFDIGPLHHRGDERPLFVSTEFEAGEALLHVQDECLGRRCARGVRVFCTLGKPLRSRPTSASAAPCAPSDAAIARPMPPFAPFTSADRPWRCSALLHGAAVALVRPFPKPEAVQQEVAAGHQVVGTRSTGGSEMHFTSSCGVSSLTLSNPDYSSTADLQRARNPLIPTAAALGYAP